MVNTRTFRQNDTGGFVPQNAVSVHRQAPNPAVLPEVLFASADSCGPDVHQDLALARLGNRCLVHSDGVVRCHYETWVLPRVGCDMRGRGRVRKLLLVCHGLLFFSRCWMEPEGGKIVKIWSDASYYLKTRRGHLKAVICVYIGHGPQGETLREVRLGSFCYHAPLLGG
jgi:hypothetical protein